MVAAVNMIFICPKCDAPMTSVLKPKRCPKCQYLFNKDGEALATELEWPKAPSRQLFEIIQQETDAAIPKDAKELLPDMDEKAIENLNIGTKLKQEIIKKRWEAKKEDFFRTTEAQDIEELVQCIHYVMSRCISSGDKDLIGKCKVWAEKFGKMSEYLKLFTENGGEVYVRANKATESGDSKSS